MRDVVIVEAVRTPLGRRNGWLRESHPVKLGSQVLCEALARANLDPAHIEHVIYGCVSQVGEQTFNVARNVVLDAEHQMYLPQVSIMFKGVTERHAIAQSFFAGPDYQAIGNMIDVLDGLLEAGAYVQRGDKTQAVEHFDEAFAWLLAEARRGVDIQRYKGLGEMNPDQLWETTMDPNVRRMLQVTVDDAVGADQIFTTLMGDQVEPRRQFIESNALSVVNLDV